MGDIAQRGNRLTFAKGGRAGFAVGKLVAGGVKKIKKYIDTKKGKFPETEDLTHQKGPYVGDVGSEGKKRRAQGPKGKGKSPGRPQGPGRTGRRSWIIPNPRRKYPKPGEREIIPNPRRKLPKPGEPNIMQPAAKGGRAGFKRAGAVTKADLAKRDLWTKRELKKRANVKRKSKWDIKGGISGHPLNPLKIHAEIKSHEPWRKRSDVYTRTRDDLKKSRDTKLKGIGEAFQKMDYRDEPKLKKQIHRMRGDTRPSGRVDREGLKKGKSPGRSQGPGRKGRRPWGGPKR